MNTLTQLSSYDYTKGKLPILVDIIIESGVKLFVSAVGVPPKEVSTKRTRLTYILINPRSSRSSTSMASST
jgi:hypothetical protein